MAPRARAQETAAPDEVGQAGTQFARVYAAIESQYAGPVNPDQAILNGAIRGLLRTLDPFSAFFDRDQFEALQQQTRGQTLGFGSILYVQPGKVLVLETAQGSPSARAGLGPGDEIVTVNGQRLADLDIDSLIALLRRARSEPVRLGVIHPGRVVAEDYSLKPAEVALPTVDKAFLLSPGIGYVHIDSFESKTPQETLDAIEHLEPSAAGAAQAGDATALKGLILDLRDNHGGVLQAAQAVTSLFLKPGFEVLTVRGRAGPTANQDYKTVPAPAHFDFPLVVLVNGDTASAAEVLTAALAEHDRAVVAGQPTYGKGLVETVMPRSEKTGLALTTAQYFTPSGRSIQRPLPGTALASLDATDDPAPGGRSPFHTDNGRPLAAGGGITPDVLIPAREIDPWAQFLDARGVFTDFASRYLTEHTRVTKSFAPDSSTLEDFHAYLGREGIRAPAEYWDRDQDYLGLRIRTEVFNLAFGLNAGNEVEVKGDPQVQKAAELFPKVGALLAAPGPTSRASKAAAGRAGGDHGE
jgi:carboxyl-terminal processing protease